MWYEFSGLAETNYGWTEHAKVAKAAAEALERQHGESCYLREISEAQAAELNLEEHTGLLCDAASTEADFDPSIERFPELIDAIRKLAEPVRPSQIIDLFDDTLNEGDERHEGFVEMLRRVWHLSPCAHKDWMDAYAESSETPPHSPVYATDRWVLGVDETQCGQTSRYNWEHLRWRDVPALTGQE